MKILVTGANGYLGRGIVKQLLDDENTVIAVDFDVNMVDSRAKRIPCNMFEVENAYDFFDKPDVLLHLAWRDGFVHNSYSHIKDLPHHIEFINQFCEAGIKKICVMGSMHEVGFYEGSIDENSVCHPQSFYGIAKDALRNATILMTQKNNIMCQWFRGFYIVGNSSNGSSIFSKLIQAERDGKRDFPFTLGQNQFDFIDYDKFCMFVAKAVQQDKVSGIINICEGRPEKLADRVERFIIENQLHINLQYGAFPDRPYDSKAVWGNPSKINSIMQDSK